MPPTLYLMRHGETEWSKDGRHTGRTDLNLTEAGVSEANALTKMLHGIEFANVFASPMLRARRTAALALPSAKVEVDKDLREWNYGDYEGQRTSDIVQRVSGWDLFRDGAPNGESPSELAERADRFLDGVRPLHGNLAIFSHGHLSRVLAVRWLGWPVIAGRHLLLSTASLSILGYNHNNPNEPAIVCWNMTIRS